MRCVNDSVHISISGTRLSSHLKATESKGMPSTALFAAGLLKWETATIPQEARTVNSMHSTP